MKIFKNMLYIVIISLILTLVPKQNAIASQLNENIISVKGEGIINIKPDICHISFGVITKNKNPNIAVEENMVKVDNLTSGLINFGIGKDNIFTESMNINPVYNYDNNDLKWYNCVNIISVKLENMEVIGDVLNKGIELGADSINNLRYSTSKSNEIYNRALKVAIKNASIKSKAIEEALGLNLNRVISVEELSDNYYKQGIVEEAADINILNSAKVPIHLKDLEIRALVELKYKY